MENLRQLHIIRGFAALYVVIGHSKVVFWSGGQEYIANNPMETWSLFDYPIFALDMLSSSAMEFVIVFFILSGFFIGYSFDRNNWKFKDFLINRIVRIYPPYIFSSILAVIVFVFISSYNPSLFSGEWVKPIINRMTNSYNEMNIIGALKSLLYLPQKDYIAGNLSYWSLLPEWIFYIIVPFLISYKRWPFLIFTISFLINAFIPLNFENHLLKFVFEYGFYFFLGIEIYRFITNNEWKSKMPNKFISYSISISLLFSTIAFGILCQKGIVSFRSASVMSASLLSVFSMLTLLTYPINGIIYKIGVFLGNISYSLYVCHLPIFYFLYAIITKYTGTYMFYDRIYWLMIPVAVGVSYFTYLLVEQQTLVLIKKLKNNRLK
tara:strand:- start:883 stop:2019 length:1137 start_codon:yes stop_codon:yes gene_type:complete